jgi:hypothetical protein
VSFSAFNFSYCASDFGVLMILIVVLGNLDGVDGLGGTATSVVEVLFLIGEEGMDATGGVEVCRGEGITLSGGGRIKVGEI